MIREYQKGDETAIAALEAECFSDPWSADAVIKSAGSGIRFFVFFEEGKILGYVGLQITLDEGYITNIAVTEKFRDRGIGKALLSHLDKLSEELSLSFISLEVRESNLSAIALYEKMGYSSDGIRPNFYENPRENAIIMTKRR
ncbi:MAG: ribosomal protein S18-alanine N-acetyltransferase [Clostridia bacterium]|nr:ribosomal protein S18-alanine N-acetyltransferase [Clostridia bacterium]